MEPLRLIRDVEKKYCSRALTTAIIIGFCCILLGYKPIAKGLILGSLFSILNFLLIGETLPHRTFKSNKSKKKSFALALGSIIVRYALMAIPIVMALKSEAYNLFSVIFGVFMIQIMILSDHGLNFVVQRTEDKSRKALWKN